jgi:hypothetical protein
MESDLDREDLKSTVSGARQRHVGDPGQAVPHHIDDLRVENITTQQQFIGFELRAHRTRWELCSQHEIDQLHPVVFELDDPIPADQNRFAMTQLHEESCHEWCFSQPIQTNGEINHPPELGTVGGVDLLTGGAGEPEHGSSMTMRNCDWSVLLADPVAIR